MSNPPVLKAFLVFSIVLFITACSSQSPKPQPAGKPPLNTEIRLKLGTPLKISAEGTILAYPTEFNFLNGWREDNHALAYNAFQHSCSSWRKQADDKPLGGIVQLGKLGDWKKLCDIKVPGGAEKQFFETWFKPYAMADHDSFEGLFTGYYLPELHGSYQKSARYHVPVYKVPSDLVKRDSQIGRIEKGQFVAYYDRAAIAAGALNGKNAEILWVDNEIDAFFMEVQGSGRIIMEDGHIQGVGFAGKNGHPYFAIGKWLADNGYIPLEQISMQSIRAWIMNNPVEGYNLMLKNPSVVFFRFTDADPDLGPVGTMNTPLTAGYSLAVDNKLLPLGVPIWLDAAPAAGEQQPLRRLVMAQDTGGAIKGLIRGDVYWGQGRQAGEIAGLMKARGRMFLLVPKHLILKT